jgi:hypothetical protein
MRKVDSEAGRAVRLRDSVPLLTTFGERLTGKGRRVPPKSTAGQSIVYAKSNWTALYRYPENGELMAALQPGSYALHWWGTERGEALSPETSTVENERPLHLAIPGPGRELGLWIAPTHRSP